MSGTQRSALQILSYCYDCFTDEETEAWQAEYLAQGLAPGEHEQGCLESSPRQATGTEARMPVF